MCDWSGAYRNGSCVGQLQPCGRGGAQRLLGPVRHGLEATWTFSRANSSRKQPTRTKKRLMIPTIATRSGTPGSRSCMFATSAHRPKCRIRRDPSHHSGRQHRNERQVHMQRVMQAQAQNYQLTREVSLIVVTFQLLQQKFVIQTYLYTVQLLFIRFTFTLTTSQFFVIKK